jgi:transcriptional regulator with XRE-family HTH domain
VARIRKELALSRREFSRLTGYSERAIANWEGGRTPDEPALRRIKEIDRLRARLAGVIKPAFIAEWLSTPNDEFDGLKPLEVIERGEVDRLWDMIFYLESGIAS